MSLSQILKEYGGIAAIEVFMKRSGSLGFRKILTRFITVKAAAKFHKVPLNEFMMMVQTAIDKNNPPNHKHLQKNMIYS